MISWLHLLWIVPLSACFGFFIASLCIAIEDVEDGYNDEFE